MKSFLILVLVVMTSLAFAGSAWALTVVSLDTTMNGTVNVTSGGATVGKEDLSLNSLAVGTQFDKFTVGMEYGLGAVKSTSGGHHLIVAF